MTDKTAHKIAEEDPTVHTPTEDEKAEYDKKFHSAVITEAKIPVRVVKGKTIIWSPQLGSQTSFMSCPIFECLYHGTRGPGKTDCLIMAFAQHVGQGHGRAWRGIIFRQTYPQLADVQAKTEKWFRLMFPTAKFNRGKMQWEFAGGEMLMLRHFNKPSDYWKYHGHEYPFIGWEEISNWASVECYKSMISCCRSSTPGVPHLFRATTNPYGPGHNWVKHRFQLFGKWWTPTIQLRPKDENGNVVHDRAAIYGHIDENKILLAADPEYKKTIISSAANKAMGEAWLWGSWDIVSGGMFEDVWDHDVNIVPRFIVPHDWRVDRSFDWGSSHPFSVGWWALSDGSDLQMSDGSWRSTVRGDIFRIKEWYGCTGQPNQGLRITAKEVATGIVERELIWKFRDRNKCYVRPGPADTNIFTVESGHCVATDMQQPVRIDGNLYDGITWTRADKRPGSRVQGWEQMRKMMKDAKSKLGLPRESPGLFVVGVDCGDFLRTVLSLPRDDIKIDDVNTKSEDHIGDEVRYRVRATGMITRSRRTTGQF